MEHALGATLGHRAGVEQLKRWQTSLRWTLEQVAEHAYGSMGMLSVIEARKRRSSVRSWQRIRQRLGTS